MNKNITKNSIKTKIYNAAMKLSNNNTELSTYVAENVFNDLATLGKITKNDVARSINDYAMLYLLAKKLGLTPGTIIRL